jgi:hypothetical protein
VATSVVTEMVVSEAPVLVLTALLSVVSEVPRRLLTKCDGIRHLIG